MQHPVSSKWNVDRLGRLFDEAHALLWRLRHHDKAPPTLCSRAEQRMHRRYDSYEAAWRAWRGLPARNTP